MVEYNSYARASSERLNQFIRDGYRINQYDEEFFMVEKMSSLKAITCESIGTAEMVCKIAINIKKGNVDHSHITTRNSIIDKAYILLGQLDVMYTAKNGDKVRRRINRRSSSEVQDPG